MAYVRVSTDGQVGEDRFGVESQKKVIQEYCESKGHEILEWYVDEGESGVKESRPAFDKILFGEVFNPPVEAVVVAKSDRVARDIKLYYYFMMLLEKKCIRLVSATEEVVNDDTGLGSVYKALMLFVAEQERRNINRRTQGGRAIKALRGGYAGGRVPYGYKAEGRGLTIVEDEAEIVRVIFQMREIGNTYREIAEYLNDVGYPSKNGKKWVTSSIQSIYENRKTYQGYYRYGNIDWVRGMHKAIIEEDE